MVRSLSRVATSFWTADFNGDGNSDLLFQNFNTSDVAVWDMVGTQIVAAGPVGTVSPDGGIHQPADFNGDGKSDLLVESAPVNHAVTISVWQMNGTQPASITPITAISDTSGWRLSFLGDFNGDGKTDVTFLSDLHDASNLNDLAIWQMNGSQIVSSTVVGGINTAAGWSVVGVNDFNGDGKSDFLFSNGITHDIAVWLMDGASIQSVSPLGNVNAAQGWRLADTPVGDFNGDGKADLLFINNVTHGVAVWLTDGNHVTAAALVGTANSPWFFTDTGDFNGDGKSDLMFMNNSTHAVAVWLMNGTQVDTGTQVGTIGPSLGYAGSLQGLQDLNGDHKSDILFQNTTTGDLVAWEMDGTHVAVNQQIGTINVAQGWHLADMPLLV